MINRLIDNYRQKSENKQAKAIAEAFSFHPDFERIYHYQVRKTGGVSLNLSFFQLNGKEPAGELYKPFETNQPQRIFAGQKVYVGWDKEFIEQGHYFYGFSHIPMHFLQLPPNSFTFTCLRDPVNRVLAHYDMLRYLRDNNPNHPSLKNDGKWLGNSLNDFLDNCPKSHLLNQLFMFSGGFNAEEAAENVKKLNFFMYMVSFEEDLTKLGKLLNLELELFQEAPYKNREDIKESELTRLREMLEPEYVLLKMLA
ncbi:MAG: hypothetical protein AAF502_04290 [Bacteroidota bacterium]